MFLWVAPNSINQLKHDISVCVCSMYVIFLPQDGVAIHMNHYNFFLSQNPVHFK